MRRSRHISTAAIVALIKQATEATCEAISHLEACSVCTDEEHLCMTGERLYKRHLELASYIEPFKSAMRDS